MRGILIYKGAVCGMKEKLEAIKQAAAVDFEAAADLKGLEDLRIKYLGRKSELTQTQKLMGSLSPDERPAMGQLVNDTRSFIEEKLGEIKNKLNQSALESRLSEEAVDITMPGKRAVLGHYHPMSAVIDQVTRIFIGMGYCLAQGPDIEDYYHNFDALNIPETHTAREEQDTFYIEGGYLLRSSTSTVQVRTMEKTGAPIRIIAPGCVYRSDEVDATHSPVFHQLEGLLVDKNITMGDLKGALAVFARELLGNEIKVRFRPHYFPFTEPSAEMDVSCFACGGVGCRICKDSGYIELLGCGMVHPRVLDMCGIDTNIYTGFAFGMGLERLAMRRFNITDMRLLYENDVKFLKQF